MIAGADPLAQPFTGPLTPLERLARVSPGTLVITWDAHGAPRARQSGELLVPSWRPFGSRLDAMPVTTEVVPLQIGIDDLVTLDRARVEHLVLRLQVQVVREPLDRLLALVRDVGPTFGSYLMEQVQAAVERDVRAAFRMNTLTDLRRQTPTQILGDRWLARDFADGVLLRRSFSVTDVDWPASTGAPERPQATARPASQPAGGGDGGGPSLIPPTVELSMEARLHRVWRLVTGRTLRGVASAAAEDRALVVAVSDAAPGAYEAGRMLELFTEILAVRHVTLTVLSADRAGSYPDLVAEWMQQVDPARARGVQVESLAQQDRLRIWRDLPVDAEPDATPDAAVDLAVAALRRLLPHRSVEVIGRPRR